MRSVVAAALLVLATCAVGGAAAAAPQERLALAVSIPTVSYQEADRIDYTQLQRFHQFLRDSFPRVFSQLEVETVRDYSLLLRWPGSDPARQPVLFIAHMDVVPVEPGTEGDWQEPAFDGVIAEGRIYGRGAVDDKQGVMSLLEAAEQLLAEGYTPGRSIIFAFGHDEEISGRQGAARIAALLRERGMHFEWMMDEGGLLLGGNPLLPDRPLAMVNVAEKAYLTLTLVATGLGGHSSNPPRVSTIGRLSNAMAKLEANPFPARLEPPVTDMLEALAPYLPQPRRFIFDNLWLTAPLVAGNMADDRQTLPYVRTTTALTMFNAGVKENVMPQRAEARVNFRLLPGDTPEQVVERVRAIIDDPLVEISYDDWETEPSVADPDGPGFKVIAAAINGVYPEAAVVPSLLIAATDSRHYTDLADDQYRFRGVLLDSAQAGSIHGTNEYVEVESYLKAIAIMHRILQRAGE